MADRLSNPTAEALPWYHAGLAFSCTCCGNCCGGGPGNVWVSKVESEAIARFLGLPPEEFQRRHTRKEGWRRALLEQPNWDCEFLETHPDGRKTCRIYPVRPTQCRTWPFWKSIVRSDTTWAHAGKGCPGIDRGPTHPLPVIQQALAANGALPL